MSALSRRTMLKGLAAGALTAATAAAALQGTTGTSHADETTEQFDYVYNKRRIQGVGLKGDFTSPLATPPRLLIDGQELHVMANANGTYSTATNHYQAFPTLRAAAEASVDELDGAQLSPMHHHHR
jgi:hypothetical protein